MQKQRPEENTLSMIKRENHNPKTTSLCLPFFMRRFAISIATFYGVVKACHLTLAKSISGSIGIDDFIYYSFIEQTRLELINIL